MRRPPKEPRKAFSGQVLSAVPGRKTPEGTITLAGDEGCGDRKRRAFAEWSYWIRKTLAQEQFGFLITDD